MRELLSKKRFKKNVAVIMAGGHGKRLWPLSTESEPKQLNRFFSKKTMLVEVYERACSIFPRANVVVVTTEALADDVKKLIPIDDKNLIIQPENMDTIAAICMSALILDVLFPECTAVFLYSDHFISNSKKFRKAIINATRLALNRDEPIAIGTKPTFADTQLGYIEKGRSVRNKKNLFIAKAFHEKPNKMKATEYVGSGNYVWNTGVKVWRTTSLLNAIKNIRPDLYKGLVELRGEIGGAGYQKKLNSWFSSIKAESFEKTISERIPNLLLYIADYGWRDIGNWASFYEIANKDEDHNVMIYRDKKQKIKLRNSEGCLVAPKQDNVVIAGVSDLIVVQSKDTLLICSRDMAPDIKDVIDK